MIIIRIKRKGIELLKLVFVIVLFVIALSICGHTESHYTMKGTVTGREREMIIVEDKQGHIWRYIDYSDRLKEGQRVSISFYNKGTEDDRTDDEIIKIRVDKDNRLML